MNYIIFNPDEMRAESVGCYGHPLVRTPNIDRLASEGVRFDNAFCQHTVCTPSRCSFVTGWYPHVHGHRTLWHALRPDEPQLYGYLHDAGHTIWWDGGHNDMLSRESFLNTVDEWHNHGGGARGANPFASDDPGYHSFLLESHPGPIEEHADAAKVYAAIDFLRSGPRKPFLIHLPLSLPHPPYSAPEPWHSMYSPDDIPPLRPPDGADRPDYHELIRRYRRLGELSDEFMRQINATYLGQISFMDKLLGDLLDALAETGLDKDTVVLFFSDHGDYAGDYGLVEKWPSGLEDVLTRVPLIIRCPGGKPGHVVTEQVELFDIMATVLELEGITPRHTHFAQSLVPQIHGAAGDPTRAVFAEGGYDTHEPHCFEGRMSGSEIKRAGDKTHPYYPKMRQQQVHPDSVARCAMIRTPAHKLVRRTQGVQELYHLEKDPLELQNVYAKPEFAGIRQKLSERLLEWYMRTSDVTPFDEDPRGIPPAPDQGFSERAGTDHSTAERI